MANDKKYKFELTESEILVIRQAVSALGYTPTMSDKQYNRMYAKEVTSLINSTTDVLVSIFNETHNKENSHD